ncbi:MAG: TrkH family potassium uptake protein [Vampirovibrionia bacterium]
MRIFRIANYIGFILILFSALLILPIFFGIYYGEVLAIEAFAISAIITAILGIIIIKITPPFKEIHRNEGLVIVAITWALMAFLGAIPYLFFNIHFVDAIFESMSGITTTGATILKDFTLYPKAMFFWRSFTQWIGGMGIIVLFIAILPKFAIAGRQLFFSEVPGPIEDDLSFRIKQTAVKLWLLYIILTVVEIILLTLAGMPFFDSICNSLSTLAAGGFSPHPESIMGYHSNTIEWIVIAFMFLAGTNFSLQYKIFTTQRLSILKNSSEFLIYTLVFIIATILITFVLVASSNQEIFNSVRIAAFQAISILTTTGFATTDFNYWTDAGKIILVALMFIGGCASSSAGGIKVVRIIILFKAFFNEVIRLLHPKAILSLRLDNQIVNKEILRQIVVFILIYLVLLIISSLLVGFIESNMIVGFTASAATIGNIGPGFGPIGPMGSYADLSTLSKNILIFDMWTGRLELIAVIIFLSPYTWKATSLEEKN